eukprot:gnl/TRDRNA2_/TRDRNA2_177939_c3_seq1.p2 gnl/TRDRNA2_/TRDRNA2_177939_c3~~gnl/TRDRNA2_/TRDRNA2_177939_c3_seq1.p2  ORF type:complete len:101 (-),score=6.54 gnl/TRDRNA2_/TRDRNA2_177939_c3_seq1:83-385(-)
MSRLGLHALKPISSICAKRLLKMAPDPAAHGELNRACEKCGYGVHWKTSCFPSFGCISRGSTSPGLRLQMLGCCPHRQELIGLILKKRLNSRFISCASLP